MMIGLWLALGALLFIAFCFIFLPLSSFFRKNKIEHSIQKQQNINIFHDRLHELELEKNQGTLAEETFLTLKTELEKTLLQDAQDQEAMTIEQTTVSGSHWSIAATLGLAVTIISLSMYFDIGRSDDLLISRAIADNQEVEQQRQAGKKVPPSMEQSVALLESKIAKDPSNKEKLFLLANSYSALGQFKKSAKVYEKMASMTQPDSMEYAGIKGALAQTLFQASGEKMTPEIQDNIKQALAIDPLEPSSLMLQGIEAFSTTQYKQAIEFWNKAKQKSGKMQISRFIEPAIKAAEGKLGVEGTTTTAEITQQSTSAGSVTINLTLSDALKSTADGDLTIFVFARPVGGRMPLAAERVKVKELPIQIVLDDTKAAMPTATISSVDKVEVTARISLSGQAMPQKGDMFTTIKGIVVKDNATLDMEINQTIK
jgi:cytochrome c-type biogenesis protein CcmH